MNIPPLNIAGTLDVDTIVEKLMQLERRPLVRMQSEKASVKSKLSALGILASNLSNLRGAAESLGGAGGLDMTASVSDTSFFTATASPTAVPGTHSIEIKNTATAQSLYSAAFSSPTDAVADLSSVPTQQLRIQVGSSQAVTITVDASNNSLQGIRDAINASGLGVRASVVYDGSGYRLTLASTSMGQANRIVLTVDEDGDGLFEQSPQETDTVGLSRLAFNPTYDSAGAVTGGTANLTQSQAAVDAVLRVDGLEVTRATNTVSDLIEGVTLELKRGDGYASTQTLTVSKDDASFVGKVRSLVTAYNAVVDNVVELRGSVAKKGILNGDTMLLRLKEELRRITSTAFAGTTLDLLGLVHDKGGKLTLDEEALRDALERDEAGVVAAFEAMSSGLKSTLDGYIDEIIPSRKDGLDQALRRIEKREDILNRRLELTETNLRKRFTGLDALLNRLQGVSNFLAVQNFDILAGRGRSQGG